jgi:hypothetical protein
MKYLLILLVLNLKSSISLINATQYSKDSKVLPKESNAYFNFKKLKYSNKIKIKERYQPITNGLTNHWSFDKNTFDLIGKAHASPTFNTMFTLDKNNKPNSAIYLNDGFLTVPQGVYFYQEFTISVWIKPVFFANWARIIDFSNTVSENNRKDLVAFSYTQETNGKPQLSISNEYGFLVGVTSNQSLRIGQWSFVTAVLRGNTGYIYINGQQTAEGPMNFKPRNVERFNNYIGKPDTYEYFQQHANAVLDDLRIFNRALDPNEINLLMSSN